MLLARWYKVSHKIGPGWEGLLSEFEARYFVARSLAHMLIKSQYIRNIPRLWRRATACVFSAFFSQSEAAEKLVTSLFLPHLHLLLVS